MAEVEKCQFSDSTIPQYSHIFGRHIVSVFDLHTPRWLNVIFVFWDNIFPIYELAVAFTAIFVFFQLEFCFE